jgi:hypothetical protein
MARKPERTEMVGVHWSLPTEARQRFGAFAAFSGRTESELVLEAIQALMRGFFVGQRGTALKAPQTDGDEPPATVPLERRESA